MKILLTIHHELNINLGAPGVTWRLGQEYIKLGHEVSYFSFDNLPSFLPSIVQGILFPEFVANKVTGLVKNQEIDVLDASTGDVWVWSKWSNFFAHQAYPLVATRSHGLEHAVHLQLLEEVKRGNMKLSWKYPIYHGGFHLWEVANSMRLADLVLLLNEYDLGYAVQKLKVQKERAYLVKNGILDTLLNLPLQPLSEDDKIRIALIGSYIPRKGIHYSIPALNSILREFPQVEVSFLGTMAARDQVIADFDPEIISRVHGCSYLPK